VTAAGLALAASFALLAIVPLRSFREFAFVMTAGVLVDTFIVRSLLVPALTSLFGEVGVVAGQRHEAGAYGPTSSSVSACAPGIGPVEAERATARRALHARRADHAQRRRAPSATPAAGAALRPGPRRGAAGPSASVPTSSSRGWASARACSDTTGARPRARRA
jgi:hypothetical protein